VPPAPTPPARAPTAAPAAVTPPTGESTQRPTPAAGAEAPRRAINPFLSNDPNAKARRLARALISDMVTYFPQQREKGLRDGTLKELFDEEIKKSFGEYVDQVGREFAEGTTHFQEALNDILASGDKIF
jgi:hypothetical protein